MNITPYVATESRMEALAIAGSQQGGRVLIMNNGHARSMVRHAYWFAAPCAP
jgi:hypothetical protein